MSLSRRELLRGSTTPERCHIASLVVQCLPGKLAATAATIEALPGTEIPLRDERGKLVVLLELESEADLLGNITQIETTPGVISVTLVYHHFDD